MLDALLSTMDPSTIVDHGTFNVEGGYVFRWTIDWRLRKPELYGCLEDEHGNLVPGFSGWYRTTSPRSALAVVHFKMEDMA